MSLRGLLVLIGAVVVIVGLFGLLMPVSIAGPDGQSIGCGNAVAADLSTAREMDNRNPVNLPIINEVIPHTDYVAQCESALSGRRTWSIPVVIVGLVVVAGAFFVGGRAGSVRAT
ncbi:MAG TPA: aminopeptidase [Mycobacterium sp.]|nr:aminopeptidase [Mycobacterium sp.]